MASGIRQKRIHDALHLLARRGADAPYAADLVCPAPSLAGWLVWVFAFQSWPLS